MIPLLQIHGRLFQIIMNQTKIERKQCLRLQQYSEY